MKYIHLILSTGLLLTASCRPEASASTPEPAAPAPARTPGPDRHILTLEIRQTRFSLSLSDHLKDSMNATTMQIPVDKQFYDEVHVGSSLSDQFRTGSLLLNGSIGNWKVTVKNKTISN